MSVCDLSRSRLKPYAHQIEGVEALVNNRAFALFDEMGAGKTKQVIDAAQVLFCMGLIDKVLVIAPASVRSGVWFDIELGELTKHLWGHLPCKITEFHSVIREWKWFEKDPGPRLEWMITNYEFIRSKTRLLQLLPFGTAKTLLVLDESSYIKNRTAEQTKACFQLRNRCGRIVLLNGTPIANNPMDMYSQGQIMDPKILACKTQYHYRAHYAIMAQNSTFPQIIGWQNLPELQQRFAPYVLRRLKKDCLDLPGKLPSVEWLMPLTPSTWKYYKEMRDDMVAWLKESNEVSIASQAIVKMLRLAQITSGFLGGLEIEAPVEEERSGDRPAWIPTRAPQTTSPSILVAPPSEGGIKEIGREKLDFVLERWHDMIQEDFNLKIMVWCRFRPEMFRMLAAVKELRESHPTLQVCSIHGDQKEADRNHALRMLDPRTAPEGPVFGMGTYGTGALGLNFTACHTVVNCSYDHSLFKFLQSGDRFDRPGQLFPVSYFDVVATGPAGQKTVDHLIIRARNEKESLATWTASAWVRALTEE